MMEFSHRDTEHPGEELLDRFIDYLNSLQADTSKPLTDLTSASGLADHGLPPQMVEALTGLVGTGVDEQLVVLVFLYLLSQKKQIKKRLARSTQRIITKAYKQLPDISDETHRRIEEIIESHFKTTVK